MGCEGQVLFVGGRDMFYLRDERNKIYLWGNLYLMCNFYLTSDYSLEGREVYVGQEKHCV